MHESSLRKSANRKKRTANAVKKPKRNSKPQIKKQVNQWNLTSKSSQLIDETIQRIDEQFRYVEIKMAIEQFMANQMLDQLQRKGLLNEEEIKSIYSNTHRFWKDDLRGEGDPFRNIDLNSMPLLQFYRMKLGGLSSKAAEGIQGRIPSNRESDRKNPVYNSGESREIKTYVSQLKEEVRGFKKDMIKQKIQDIKQFVAIQ